jgi:hypothetical protein
LLAGRETVTRRIRVSLAAVAILAILGAVVRNQIKVSKGRQARAAAAARQRAQVSPLRRLAFQHREALFDMAMGGTKAGSDGRGIGWATR